jgi:predicted transposase/invertase (TIGR01784 family)
LLMACFSMSKDLYNLLAFRKPLKTPSPVPRCHELADSELQPKVVQLIEELLIRRFVRLSREEIRAMFQLHDLRKTKVWQEGSEEGLEKGLEQGLEQGLEKGLEQGLEQGKIQERRVLVQKCLAKGYSLQQIAELMDLSIDEVRKLKKALPSI